VHSVQAIGAENLQDSGTALITLQEEQEILAFLRAHAVKECYQALLELKQKDPLAYQQQLRQYKESRQQYDDMKRGNANPVQQSFLRQLERNKALNESQEIAITPLEEQAILTFVRELYPQEYYTALLVLKEKDPLFYQDELKRYKTFKQRYEDLKRSNPQEFQRMIDKIEKGEKAYWKELISIR